MAAQTAKSLATFGVVCGGAFTLATLAGRGLEAGVSVPFGPKKTVLAPPQGKITESVYFDVDIAGKPQGGEF